MYVSTLSFISIQLHQFLAEEQTEVVVVLRSLDNRKLSIFFYIEDEKLECLPFAEDSPARLLICFTAFMNWPKNQ
jgi:hypothetical protein